MHASRFDNANIKPIPSPKFGQPFLLPLGPSAAAAGDDDAEMPSHEPVDDEVGDADATHLLTHMRPLPMSLFLYLKLRLCSFCLAFHRFFFF